VNKSTRVHSLLYSSLLIVANTSTVAGMNTATHTSDEIEPATMDDTEKHLGPDPDDRPLDYDKMEHQQIGVTRIETLWRHFGKNRPVLTALGLSIFRGSHTLSDKQPDKSTDS
jgi:hypothetical protein